MAGREPIAGRALDTKKLSNVCSEAISVGESKLPSADDFRTALVLVR